MNKKLLLALGGILVLGIGWYLFRPERLVIDKRVNEPPPAALAPRAASTGSVPVPVSAEVTPDASNSAVLAGGLFHSVAHDTKGLATIYELTGGKMVLRLTDFETSNGPDVRVYLVAVADSRDNETVKEAQFVDVGPLKGNIGDQNYDLPTDLDLEKYQSVTIWCRRFGVNFGTAPLAQS